MPNGESVNGTQTLLEAAGFKRCSGVYAPEQGRVRVVYVADQEMLNALLHVVAASMWGDLPRTPHELQELQQRGIPARESYCLVLRVFRDLPRDVRIERVWYAPERRAFGFLLSHASFKPVPPGCAAPLHCGNWDLEAFVLELTPEQVARVREALR